MSDSNPVVAVAPETLALLGEGQVAYVRELTSEDLRRFYPEVPAVPPGLTLWALIGATGTPILIADDRDTVLAGAQEQDLIPVSLN